VRVPKYSVVVLRDGVVYKEVENVPLYKVIRLILEYRADILAVDNLNEIVESPRDIAKLSKLIPPWCRVVEVAGVEQRLVEVARKFNIESPHLTPLQAARVCAYAALNGIGREVKLYVDRTYVVVSKGRTPIQGGSSSERFKRSIRACVLRVVKEVKETLEKNGLDYDLLVKKSKGGLEKGLFVVYASLERVREVISPLRSRNVKITVKPVLTSIPVTEESSSRLVILGVDPGTTIGIAVLDFTGKPLLVASGKVPDREQVVGEVLRFGKPVIIAVDTSKPPEFAKKLASKLGAILYTPEYDLTVEEKQKLSSEYSTLYTIDIPDSHARDALAGAIKAYRSFKPLIEEVESKTRGLRGVVREKIIVEVLRGKSLVEVLDEYFMRELSRDFKLRQKTPLIVKSNERVKEDLDKLHSRIVELESIVKKLEEELKIRDKLIEELQIELKAVKKRDLSEECERRVQNLLLEIESLRKMLRDRENTLNSILQHVVSLEEAINRLIKGDLIGAVKASSLKNTTCTSKPVYLDDLKFLSNELLECIKREKSVLLTPPGVQIDWKVVKVPVVEVSPVLDFKDYVLVASNSLSNVKELWRTIEEFEAKERRRRIMEMIEEYKKSRIK
jgi:predicted RNase H-like nuclease (RuvC/YqgF family)